MQTTKQIVKQVSSGGFIFFEDKKDSSIYVLLIENFKNEYWIPKGKLEPGETQIDAAFREIEEEVGFNRSQIKYIDYCDSLTYRYDLDEERTLSKHLYINVFEAANQFAPNPTDWNDLKSVAWYSYENALATISFTRDILEKAHGMFINYKKSK